MKNPVIKKILFFIGCALVFVALSFASFALYDYVMYGGGESVAEGDSSADCNVLGINLHGAIFTYIPAQGSADDPDQYQADYGDAVASEDVVSSIRQADGDDSIKAIMLEIDSPGGYPVAGEEIANALKASKKPSVAVIRQSGTSAAYWAATGASKIFASKNSDVGSIGVTMSYLQNLDKDKKYIELASGKYKDTGSPDKPLTDDERQLLLRDINITAENFIASVAANRQIPVDQVKAIADGSSVLGDKAISLHLIDEIGSWSEAESYLQEKIGEKPELCWQ